VLIVLMVGFKSVLLGKEYRDFGFYLRDCSRG